MGFIKTVTKYKKKIERRFSKQHGRRQLNFRCDLDLIDVLKYMSIRLQVPMSYVGEHALETGLREILLALTDEALRETMQLHLLSDHLGTQELKPAREAVTKRARMLDSAIRLLDLMQMVNLEERRELMEKFLDKWASV